MLMNGIKEYFNINDTCLCCIILADAYLSWLYLGSEQCCWFLLRERQGRICRCHLCIAEHPRADLLWSSTRELCATWFKYASRSRSNQIQPQGNDHHPSTPSSNARLLDHLLAVFEGADSAESSCPSSSGLSSSRGFCSALDQLDGSL